MSRRRKHKGAVKAAAKVDRAVERSLGGTDWHDEVLRLRGVLSRVADAVGVRAVLLGPDLLSTGDEIVRAVRGDTLRRENRHWREFAWLSCVHDTAGKYGDDGEMQCRGADFRRDTVEVLSEHMRKAREERRARTYEAAAHELYPSPPGPGTWEG